jgi:hypothetical protein
MADAFHDAGIAATNLDQQRTRLKAKFHSLVEPVLGSDRSREVAQLIGRLEDNCDAGELLSAVKQ